MKKFSNALAAFVLVACIGLSGALLVGCSNNAGGGSNGNGSDTVNFQVGDIIFNDGSKVSYSEGLTLSPEQKAAAVAVIFYVRKNTDEKLLSDAGVNALGLGLLEKNNIPMAKAGTKGATELIEGAKSLTNGKSNTAAIIAYDSENYTEENYPKIWWVDHYNAVASNLGKYSSDWYMPAIDEVRALYSNADKVNASIQKIGTETVFTRKASGRYCFQSSTTVDEAYCWYHEINFESAGSRKDGFSAWSFIRGIHQF